MVATCVGEVVLAVYLALRPMSLLLALLQTGAIVTFTIILGVLEPMLLVHYLGMLSKNLPLVGCIWVCWLLTKEGWTPRSTWLLRAAMAVVWITEGIFPKMLFLQTGEVEVVQAIGLSAQAAATLIWITGLCQALSGVAALVLRGTALRALLLAQLLALVFLPQLVTVVQPEMWVHPFGPLTKVVPIVVGTAILWRQCVCTSS